MCHEEFVQGDKKLYLNLECAIKKQNKKENDTQKCL